MIISDGVNDDEKAKKRKTKVLVLVIVDVERWIHGIKATETPGI